MSIKHNSDIFVADKIVQNGVAIKGVIHNGDTVHNNFLDGLGFNKFFEFNALDYTDGCRTVIDRTGGAVGEIVGTAPTKSGDYVVFDGTGHIKFPQLKIMTHSHSLGGGEYAFCMFVEFQCSDGNPEVCVFQYGGLKIGQKRTSLMVYDIYNLNDWEFTKETADNDTIALIHREYYTNGYWKANTYSSRNAGAYSSLGGRNTNSLGMGTGDIVEGDLFIGCRSDLSMPFLGGIKRISLYQKEFYHSGNFPDF